MEEQKITKNSEKKLRPWMIILAVAVLIVGGAVGAFLYWESTLVWGTCYVEAGVEITPADFMKEQTMEAAFTEDCVVPDTTIPGEYPLVIKAMYMNHKSTLIVQDTIPPVAEVTDKSVTVGEVCEAADFITYMEDATEVNIEFVETPDFEQCGEQPVSIRLTDAGNNELVLDTTVYISSVLTDIYVEAGSNKPKLSDFVVGGTSSKFVTNIDNVDYAKPQKVKVSIIVDGITYESTMHIQDTTMPVVEFQDVKSFTGLSRSPEDFIVSAEDNTTLKYSFENAPDLNKEGEQDLVVNVADRGGNITSGNVKLTLEKDTEPPVIEGVKEISVFVNATISYMADVKISDNCEQGLNIKIVHDKVNPVLAGDYPIQYIATDASGNTTQVDSVVHVRERVYDEATIYGLADAVIASIITPGMSNRDKVQAIFNYVKGHVAYSDGSAKHNYLRAAYEGLAEHRGDCFVYAATSRALLTRAGIPNMDIAKIPAATHHYWNLVDIGDGHGWYHFDTTPRRDHPVIFLWDENTLMTYSAQHNNSHNYDHELYPVVP